MVVGKLLPLPALNPVIKLNPHLVCFHFFCLRPSVCLCSGSEDQALLAYQIAFELVDAELATFMLKVLHRAPPAWRPLTAAHSRVDALA